MQRKCNLFFEYSGVEKKESDANCLTTVHSVDLAIKKRKNSNALTIHIFGPRESGKTSFVINFCERKYDTFLVSTEKKRNINVF